MFNHLKWKSSQPNFLHVCKHPKDIINDFGRSLQKPYEDQGSIHQCTSGKLPVWIPDKDISHLMGQVINATTPNCIEEIHHKCADEREVYINNIITHLYDLPLSERLVAFYYFFLFGIGICANVLVMRFVWAVDYGP